MTNVKQLSEQGERSGMQKGGHEGYRLEDSLEKGRLGAQFSFVNKSSTVAKKEETNTSQATKIIRIH